MIDALPIYRLLELWNIRDVIALNSRCKHLNDQDRDYSINQDGVPVCLASVPMVDNGFCKNRNRRKFRCPLACGKIDHCDYKSVCQSESAYGRTVQGSYINGTLSRQPALPAEIPTFIRHTGCEKSDIKHKAGISLQMIVSIGQILERDAVQQKPDSPVKRLVDLFMENMQQDRHLRSGLRWIVEKARFYSHHDLCGCYFPRNS